MKKLFTLLMMFIAVLTVNAQSVVYTLDTTLEENKGTDNGYATAGEVTCDGLTWNATGNITMNPWRVGGKSLDAVDRAVKTTNAFGTELSKVVLTLGNLVDGIEVNSVTLSWADNADFAGAQSIVKDYANEIEFVADFAANSFYKFDINVTVPGSSNKYVQFIKVEFYGNSTPAAGWDGSVTTSLDGTVIANKLGVEGMTMTFPGANSIAVEEEEGFLALVGDEWGTELLMIWAPAFGSEYEINGNVITLSGWVDYEELMGGAEPQKLMKARKNVIKKAAAEDSWYIQDYGAFIIDGQEGLYLDDIAVAHEAEAQPFELTVTNDKEENAVPAGEVAEKLSWYFYATVPEGFEINRDIQATLYKDMEVFSTAIAGQMDGTTAYWTFRNAAPDYIQEAGQYTLVVPEGVITVNGAPNAEFRGVWGVTGVEPTHEIAVVSVKNGGEEPGVVERVTTTFELELAEEVSTIGENQAGVMLINNTTNDIYPVSSINPVGKLVYITMNLGEERVLTAPGEYMLQLPDHVVVDANGNYNAGGNYTWTIEGQDMQVINIEQAAVSVTEPDTWGDQKYQIALTLPTIPEGAVYGYCEGLMVTKDGVTSNRPFTTGEWGMFTLDGNNVLFVDPMICYTTDETYDGELREPGTYVAEAEIYFMDADWMEIAAVAKYTGSVVLPQVAPVTPQATITLVADEKTEVLYDGTPVAEANSLTLSFTKAYQNVSCVVDKLTVVDGDEDMAGYTFEEEVATEEPVLGEDGNWTVNFVKQPQNFASGHQYRIKVRAWEGEKFDEEWNIQPYDETIVVVNGVGADDEPVVELNMGTPVYTTFDSAVAPDAFPGITVSYPDNNLAEVYGDTEAWGYGAFALICTSANIFELDADGNFDAENPVASEHYASNFDVESVDLFSRPALEANKKYVAIIDGMTVQNQMEWEDPIVWIQSPMEAIWIYFETGVATGINNVNADDNTNTYNVAGQRVNNSVKGIVIKNGKKYLNK